MKKRMIGRAICISGFLVLMLLIVIFTTIYSHWDDLNTQALKDSLSTTSGIFGGLTTLAAAIVAAYLYTDWREQLSLTVQQSQAKFIQLKINEILIELDTYGTFVLMHSGMGHEPEYIKDAERKVNTLIADYPRLVKDLQQNLMSYQDTYLNSIPILTEEEERELSWWYYYGITNNLNRIIKREHLNKVDDFQKYIAALKRDRDRYQILRKKINDEMIPNINIMKKTFQD